MEFQVILDVIKCAKLGVTDERDIYVDFNTFVFKIVEKRVRVLGNDKRFLQIKLEPISEDEQRSNN